MATNNFNGSIVFSGGFVLGGNPTIHYNAGALQSAPPVDAHDRGSTRSHEAHPPMPHMSSPTANTSPPARPQRSFPRSFSYDSSSHPGQEVPSFPAPLQRSSTLPLPSFDSSLGEHRLPPDWPGHYSESPGEGGSRMPNSRDSVIPFQPIGNPLQHQAITRQLQYVYDQQHGPMLTDYTQEPQPTTSPAVWGGHYPRQEHSIMPMPRYSESAAPSGTSWPVDDRDTDTTENVDQSPLLEQTSY